MAALVFCASSVSGSWPVTSTSSPPGRGCAWTRARGPSASITKPANKTRPAVRHFVILRPSCTVQMVMTIDPLRHSAARQIAPCTHPRRVYAQGSQLHESDPLADALRLGPLVRELCHADVHGSQADETRAD